MAIFKPDIYQKNIFDIPYDTLKKEGIRLLVFDLDNTLVKVSEDTSFQDVKKLIQELKKDFTVIISSNNRMKRVKKYLDELEIDGYAPSFKPSYYILNKIRKKYHLQKKEMCMIGDQMITDILSGKWYHIKTILVDPLGEKDLKITSFNRKIESLILKRYLKKGIFKRGNYYE